MESGSDESTLNDKLFVEQCEFVKQYYNHILSEEEMKVVDNVLLMNVGERRLLQSMYFHPILFLNRFLRKTAIFYTSKCSLQLVDLNSV